MPKTLTLVVLSFLTLVCSPIFIPLSGRASRCMIIYSVGEAETVKIDINFPPLKDQQEREYYEISWKNSQTNQQVVQTARDGRFRKQLSLIQNVIYDLCIRVESQRDYGMVHVDYNAANMFAVNQAEVKVPDNLLKESDITETYMNATQIQRNLQAFIAVQNEKTDTHAEIFRKSQKITQNMVMISVVQLIIIAVAGLYQFYSLWKYLKSKSYL